jgi:hypothetical protein
LFSERLVEESFIKNIFSEKVLIIENVYEYSFFLKYEKPQVISANIIYKNGNHEKIENCSDEDWIEIKSNNIIFLDNKNKNIKNILQVSFLYTPIVTVQESYILWPVLQVSNILYNMQNNKSLYDKGLQCIIKKMFPKNWFVKK